MDGRGERTAIEASLERTAELIATTGARCYEPFVHEQRAGLARACNDPEAWERELREAQRLFSELGAGPHAERVARELGSV